MREVNVLSLLVFTIDGKIIYADVGHPGRMSDNTLQPRLTHILTEPGNLAPGHGILGDDIFRNAATDRIYITQYHVPDIIDAEFVRENRNLFAVQQKAKRQGVEWGMRSIQTMWPRIKKALPNDPAKRIAAATAAAAAARKLHDLTAALRAVHSQHWRRLLAVLGPCRVSRKGNDEWRLRFAQRRV